MFSYSHIDCWRTLSCMCKKTWKKKKKPRAFSRTETDSNQVWLQQQYVNLDNSQWTVSSVCQEGWSYKQAELGVTPIDSLWWTVYPSLEEFDLLIYFSRTERVIAVRSMTPLPGPVISDQWSLKRQEEPIICQTLTDPHLRHSCKS